ncbi:MAG TPA: MBL fold metallo-hydrolase [Solirubrobacteraceae bacterium]|nr:MBL fold metallo-hydrolase [Solirubrobacteraceae bacterium]
MRVVTLHPDVAVATSRVYQTNCTAIRSGDEGFVVDSPVYPDELDLLPAVLEQAGFVVSGLLATHGDWDHVLGRLAFPGAALGVAETTAARLTGEPGEAQRELRDFDEEHYVERPRPLSLGQVQALPVPGHVGLGEHEIELHPTDGHTADGMALWLPWVRVLVCGDYLSPVEIPMLSQTGSRDAYLATLERLRPLVEQAEWVVPGHGQPIDGARALAVMREDVTYLQTWELPLARRTGAQRAADKANRERG